MVLEEYLEKETRDSVQILQNLRTNLTNLQVKIDTLEEKYYVIGEVTKEMYNKFSLRYKEEKLNILKQVEGLEKSSNPQKQVKRALELSAQLPYLWGSSSVSEKEKLQKLIFPGGILLDSQKKEVRTTTVNSVFELIHLINSDLDKNKNEKNYSFSRLSHWCPKRDSNSQVLLQRLLRPQRLPISPSGQERAANLGIIFDLTMYILGIHYCHFFRNYSLWPSLAAFLYWASSANVRDDFT
jgi:hypothetical protein